jgi:hypothetical protein
MATAGEPSPVITLKRSSMFADTDVYRDEDGAVIFDLWEPPFEYTPQPGDIIHKITARDEGQLDLLAWEYYGDENLFWIIGHVNHILHPVNEVRVGGELLIPNPDWVRNYLSKTRTT